MRIQDILYFDRFICVLTPTLSSLFPTFGFQSIAVMEMRMNCVYGNQKMDQVISTRREKKSNFFTYGMCKVPMEHDSSSL